MRQADRSSEIAYEITPPEAELKPEPTLLDPQGLSAIAQSKELLELLGITLPEPEESKDKKEGGDKEEPAQAEIDKNRAAFEADAQNVPWDRLGAFMADGPDGELDALLPPVMEVAGPETGNEAAAGKAEANDTAVQALVRSGAQKPAVQLAKPKWADAAVRKKHFPHRTRRLAEFIINEKVCVMYSKKQLMTMPHQKLTKLVVRHMRGNPKRFPPWARYMILNYTGLRYASAHGTYRPNSAEKKAWKAKYKRYYVGFQAWRYKTEKDLTPFFTKAVCDQMGSVAQRARGVTGMVKKGAIGFLGKVSYFKSMKRKGKGSYRKVRGRRQDPNNTDFKPGTTILFQKWKPCPGGEGTLTQGEIARKIQSTYGGECMKRGGKLIKRASDGKYKMWGHEATVVYVNASAGKVACFETAYPSQGAGMKYYSIAHLRSRAGVYVGWVPGGSGGTSPATNARLAELHSYVGPPLTVANMLRAPP